MDEPTFTRWLASARRLRPQQIAALDAELAVLRERAAVVLALEAGDGPLPCPRCRGARHQKWGPSRTGFQRWRCKGCGKTFTARTGTPLADVQRPGGVARLLAAMLDAVAPLSCRKAARTLDVSRTTVWRWRMLLLRALPAAFTHTPVFTGLVEMDETYQKESRKGSKAWARHAADPSSHPQPDRPQWHAWPKGTRPRGLNRRWRLPLLATVQRGGPTEVLPISRPTHAVLSATVGPRLAPDAALHTDGAFAFERFAQKAGLDHTVCLATRPQAYARPSAHINTVNGVHALWRDFIRVFRGPASKHLGLYARWFTLLRNPGPTAMEILRDMARGCTIPNAL